MKYYDNEIADLARIIHDAGIIDAWGSLRFHWRSRKEIIDGGATARMDIAMAQAKAALKAGYSK